MKKNINSIFVLSIGLLLLSLFLVGMSQWAISTNPDLSNSQYDTYKIIKYLKSETDIEKLRDIALSQADTGQTFNEFLHEVMHNSRKVFLFIFLFAALMVYHSYKIRKFSNK